MGLIAGLLQKTEDRAYPAQWFADAMGWGGKTASGTAVTAGNAITFSPFFAAVDLIARGIAQLPLPVYKRSGDSRERAPEHKVYDLLHTRPNPEQTAFVFRHTVTSWMLTWGNGYAEIQRDGAARPIALWPIPANIVKVDRGASGELVYKVREDANSEKIVPAPDMLHIRGLGDNLVGYSPVTLFRESIGLGLAAEKFGAAFFGNDARPGGVLQHPGKLSPDGAKNLLSSWKESHGGAGKASSPAILQEGMVWQSVGVPPEDAQFLETRKFQVTDIARIFHIPPHKLGDLDRATFSNIEHQAIEWVQDCLGPWLVAWEQEQNWKLFSVTERKTFFSEFLVDGLLRGDIQSRYAAYAIARTNGWLSADDIRQKENMNPLPDGQGKLYLVPMNMRPADQVGKEPTPAPAPAEEPVDAPDDEGDDRARVIATHRSLLLNLCGRVNHKETNAMRRALARREKFDEAADKFYGGHAAHICEVVAPALHAFAAAMGTALDDTALCQCATDIIKEHRYNLTIPRLRDGVLADLEKDGAASLVERLMGVVRKDRSMR